MRVLVLDSEAVAALQDPKHAHHREVLRYVEANRAARRSDPVRRTVVPTTIRVEAGWDRTSAAAAFLNHLAIADVDLDAAHADTAARLRNDHRVSPADAHVGAVIRAFPPASVTVLTSDPTDMRTVAADSAVTVIAL